MLLGLSLMPLATETGLVLKRVGETLFWGVLWRVLPWAGAGWIVVAGSSLISQFVLPFWMLVGLLRLLSLSRFLLFGRLHGFLRSTSLECPSLRKAGEFGRSTTTACSLFLWVMLRDALDGADVNLAWRVWSTAVGTALAEWQEARYALQGLVLGRGIAWLRVSNIGGKRVGKFRPDLRDPACAVEVPLNRSCSIAPPPPLGCTSLPFFSGVWCMMSSRWPRGWSSIISGLALLVMVRMVFWIWGSWLMARLLGWMSLVLELRLLLVRLLIFVRQVVVHRRDFSVRGWRNWVLEDPLVHPYRWLPPDLVPPATFLNCDPKDTVDASGVLVEPHVVDEQLRKAFLL